MRKKMTYICNSVAIRTLCIATLLLLNNSLAAVASTNAAAEGFLKQLIGAESHGMGGSFVGATRGANALGNNPAGISPTQANRFALHAVRFPRTIALTSQANRDGHYEDHSRYEQNASGIETFNWTFPIGKLGDLGVAFALQQAGAFRRVDHNGKALNSFPENNIGIGLSYGVNMFSSTVIGVDTKWLRSKVVGADDTAYLGHGYAYNIGVQQGIGEAFQIGAVVQNLSNGLSFPDPSIPNTIERSVAIGVAYRRDISDMALRIGVDAHPPFSDGIRVNIGAETWYRKRIGIRIGYLRDTQKRYTSVFRLQTSTFETEERVWKSEGLCFGLGFRLGGFIFNAAYTPQFIPSVSAEERLHIQQGAAVYAFSIGQAF